MHADLLFNSSFEMRSMIFSESVLREARIVACTGGVAPDMSFTRRLTTYVLGRGPITNPSLV